MSNCFSLPQSPVSPCQAIRGSAWGSTRHKLPFHAAGPPAGGLNAEECSWRPNQWSHPPQSQISLCQATGTRLKCYRMPENGHIEASQSAGQKVLQQEPRPPAGSSNARECDEMAKWTLAMPRGPESLATRAQATGRTLKCYRMQGNGQTDASQTEGVRKPGNRSPGHWQGSKMLQNARQWPNGS